MTLYVANFADDTDDFELEALFAQYGEVIHCRIVRHHRTQAALGYAFVSFDAPYDAERAERELNGFRWNGRILQVRPAEAKKS